jgi:hypothetical protein
LESIVDAELRRRLDAAGIAYALIGATALAVHGYVRATADVDLLTLDERVLAGDFWEGAAVKVRRGDWDDPLVGSILWAGDLQHDVIVGRGHAAHFALTTATMNDRLGCRVASPLALTLLKLEAGSAQDLYDVIALKERRTAIDGAPWVAEIAEHLPKLSAEARAAWERMQSLTT